MATRRARPTPGLVVVAAHHHPPLEVAQQMVGRTREALTDYANALLLQDWHEEQRAARRAGLVLDG